MRTDSAYGVSCPQLENTHAHVFRWVMIRCTHDNNTHFVNKYAVLTKRAFVFMILSAQLEVLLKYTQEIHCVAFVRSLEIDSELKFNKFCSTRTLYVKPLHAAFLLSRCSRRTTTNFHETSTLAYIHTPPMSDRMSGITQTCTKRMTTWLT